MRLSKIDIIDWDDGPTIAVADVIESEIVVLVGKPVLVLMQAYVSSSKERIYAVLPLNVNEASMLRSAIRPPIHRDDGGVRWDWFQREIHRIIGSIGSAFFVLRTGVLDENHHPEPTHAKGRVGSEEIAWTVYQACEPERIDFWLRVVRDES